MCTSAGWAEALTAITDETDCELPDTETGNPGNCGNYMAGVAFMIIYLVLSFLVSRLLNFFFLRHLRSIKIG